MELTTSQKTALNLFAKSPLKELFYWTGGTLLSYHYLHHRRSEDLDFFTDHPFSFSQISEFIYDLKQHASFSDVEYNKIFDRHEFILNGQEPLRIEFVHYNHKKTTLEKRKVLDGLYIDSLKDIAANKTMAYVDRNEPKDLFDIYFLIQKASFTPRKLLQLASQKFDITIPESSFWSQAFVLFPLLSSLQPLLPDGKQTKNTFKEIEDYFKKGSQIYLDKTLD